MKKRSPAKSGMSILKRLATPVLGVRCFFEVENPVPLLSVSVFMDVNFLSDMTDEELRDWQDNNDEIGNAGYFDFGEETLDSDEGVGFHIIDDAL